MRPALERCPLLLWLPLQVLPRCPRLLLQALERHPLLLLVLLPLLLLLLRLPQGLGRRPSLLQLPAVLERFPLPEPLPPLPRAASEGPD